MQQACHGQTTKGQWEMQSAAKKVQWNPTQKPPLSPTQSKSEWVVNKGANQGLRYLSKLKKYGVWVTRPYHLVVFLARQLDSVVKIQSIAAHTFIPLRFKIWKHCYALQKKPLTFSQIWVHVSIKQHRHLHQMHCFLIEDLTGHPERHGSQERYLRTEKAPKYSGTT